LTWLGESSSPALRRRRRRLSQRSFAGVLDQEAERHGAQVFASEAHREAVLAAYCSAAIAASMLAVSACSKRDAGACPFDGFGGASPFVWPFTAGAVSEGVGSLGSLSFLISLAAIR
jgi:hypothetical protein